MIEILPIKDSETLSEQNEKFSVNATHGFVCLEKKEIIAVCLYKVDMDTAYFLHVSTNEEFLFDGMVRASFASLIMGGTDKAKFAENFDIVLLKKLNFVQDDTFFVKSLSEIIDKCKNCKNT